MIHKITPSVDYNQWLTRLNTQPNETANQNSLKSPKLLSQRKRRRYFKTLGTSVITSLLALLSLVNSGYTILGDCGRFTQLANITEQLLFGIKCSDRSLFFISTVAVYSALTKWGQMTLLWPTYSINVSYHYNPSLFQGVSFPIPFLFPSTMTSIE